MELIELLQQAATAAETLADATNRLATAVEEGRTIGAARLAYAFANEKLTAMHNRVIMHPDFFEAVIKPARDRQHRS